MSQIRYIKENDIDVVDLAPAKPPIIPGTEKKKSIFSEAQNKAAGFALRMEAKYKIMNDIEDSGFNPVNLYDSTVDNLPLIPDWLERPFLRAKYLMYENAKLDFGYAQLRQETGAQVNASEFAAIDDTYFPKFGEPPEVLLQKRQARKAALDAMKGVAGAAYDEVKKSVLEEGGSQSANEALAALRKRAQNDDELRQKLIDRGLMDE